MSVDYGDVVEYHALPLRERRERRRAQIREAAGAEFVANGYYASRMDDIAERAGISKPVLYQHFSSKLELYLAVLQTYIDALVGDVREALRSTDDNMQRVHAAVQAYFDFVDHETQEYRLVFESALTSEPSVQLRVARGVDACINAVFEMVSRDSELDAFSARAMAVGLVGASQLAAQYWLEAGRPVPKKQAIDATVALCWGGLSRVPRRTAD
ncbi:TetR/AcrR family transcriptional regulator [Nocardia sp. NPDC059246]|uniref:TetR/AcrR family transcriptional regulator n=1 Tax=unclassified Nocardia TaxID=2637762 RepID=UPI00368ED0DF